MLTPRELEVLDVVGEVMQERLQEVRKEYEGKLSDLQTKVAALEDRASEFARTKPDRVEVARELMDALEARFASLPPPPEPVDLTPFTEKIATLEARAPEVTLETMRKMGDDLEEVIERRLAMIPPPPDLTPITLKIAAWDEQPSPATVLQMAQKAVAEGQADTIARLEAKIDALPPPPLVDLTWVGEKFAELETRPTNEQVLKLAEGALHSTRASLLETLQIAMVDLFKALPIPEKGDPGEPGKGVTAEQFRDLFEASYAKFELETERRIMDLVQRTLDRVPVPKDGKDGVDGFGFDDFTPTFDGERTLTFCFAKDDRVKEFAFTLSHPLDGGVWKAGTPYVRGDGVTWGGSWWIAQRDNPGKPDDGPDCGWRLAVKHGRDGKPGAPGIKGDPGAPGKNGRDLNQRLSGGFDP